ncbi:hypothetical protein [Flavobacterium sp. LB2R40]|uniref:hypothetical protein n=1 Tax=unclassified Flavobacterium TaxID=196869 RepID=UPI003AAFAEAC
MDASTTQKSKAEGLNDSFENLVANYTLDTRFIEPFNLQLNKLFDTMSTEGKSEMKSLTSKEKELEMKTENLNKRYFDKPNFGDEKYNKYVLQFGIELKPIEEQKEMNEKNYLTTQIHRKSSKR